MNLREVKRADEIFDFNYKPRDIKAHLDRFVIRQDEAKKALSIAVCDHYNHAKYMRSYEQEHGKTPDGIEYQKQNVIVRWSNGCRKNLSGEAYCRNDGRSICESGRH